MFCKKGVLRKFAKFTGKHVCQPATLFKKETLAQVFSSQLCEISRNTFPFHCSYSVSIVDFEQANFRWVTAPKPFTLFVLSNKFFPCFFNILIQMHFVNLINLKMSYKTSKMKQNSSKIQATIKIQMMMQQRVMTLSLLLQNTLKEIQRISMKRSQLRQPVGLLKRGLYRISIKVLLTRWWIKSTQGTVHLNRR